MNDESCRSVCHLSSARGAKFNLNYDHHHLSNPLTLGDLLHSSMSTTNHICPGWSTYSPHPPHLIGGRPRSLSQFICTTQGQTIKRDRTTARQMIPAHYIASLRHTARASAKPVSGGAVVHSADLNSLESVPASASPSNEDHRTPSPPPPVTPPVYIFGRDGNRSQPKGARLWPPLTPRPEKSTSHRAALARESTCGKASSRGPNWCLGDA